MASIRSIAAVSVAVLVVWSVAFGGGYTVALFTASADVSGSFTAADEFSSPTEEIEYDAAVDRVPDDTSSGDGTPVNGENTTLSGPPHEHATPPNSPDENATGQAPSDQTVGDDGDTAVSGDSETGDEPREPEPSDESDETDETDGLDESTGSHSDDGSATESGDESVNESGAEDGEESDDGAEDGEESDDSAEDGEESDDSAEDGEESNDSADDADESDGDTATGSNAGGS